MSPNITPETDGVYTVSAGGSEIIGDGYPFGAFYLLGTGKVYIRGKRDAIDLCFVLFGTLKIYAVIMSKSGAANP